MSKPILVMYIVDGLIGKKILVIFWGGGIGSKGKLNSFFQKKSRDKSSSEKRRYSRLQVRLATLYSFRNMGYDMADEIDHVRKRIKDVLTERGKKLCFKRELNTWSRMKNVLDFFSRRFVRKKECLGCV